MRRHMFLAPVVIVCLVVLVGIRAHASAQEATPTVETDIGVTFGETTIRPLQLDVFLPPNRDQPQPAVLLFHAWGDSRSAMNESARELAKAGYIAITVDYRADWPEFIDDAQLAVRWLRANADRYGVDPERICAYGWSAGGQLAAMLAVRDTRDDADPTLAEYSSQVACAVDLAGITDASLPGPTSTDDTWEAEALGGTPQEAPAAYQDVSPVAFVDEQSAPILVIQGSADSINPVEQSRQLVSAMQDAGAEVIYAELAGESHLSVADWTLNGPFTLAFLDRHLHPES